MRHLFVIILVIALASYVAWVVHWLVQEEIEGLNGLKFDDDWQYE